MGIEIERKFLLKNNSWKTLATNSLHIIQGYFENNKCVIRIRMSTDDYCNKSFVTFKPISDDLLVRQEYEYEIPFHDAEELLLSCNKFIEKIRFSIPIDDLIWEIDVFKGKHEGLILAEVELPSKNYKIKSFPEWIGEEVTNKLEYTNAFLAK